MTDMPDMHTPVVVIWVDRNIDIQHPAHRVAARRQTPSLPRP
jgi:hypothetical protein